MMSLYKSSPTGMVLVYALLVVLALLAALWWGTSAFSRLSTLPGPRPLPFVGNLHFLMSRPPTEAQAALIERYGGVLRFFAGRRGVVLVSDPDVVHEVTVTAADKFRNRPQNALRFRSMGLLSARDDYWKQLRRIITPTFNVIHLKQMLIPMHEEVQVLLANLEAACEAKREVDIHSMFTKLTLDIIGRVAFGTKLNAQSGAKSQLIEASTCLLRDIPRNNGFLAILFPKLWGLKQKVWPSGFRAQVQKASQVLDEITLSLIRKRKAERQHEEGQASSTESEGGGRIANDFLDLLLDARDKTTGEALSEKEICDQAILFLLAGHETTANALSYTIYLLAQHPDVDDQLFDELCDVHPKHEELWDLNKLSSLNRLGMVFKESLRMYPPATSTAREPNTDVVIGGQYIIPAGVPVIIPIKVIATDPQLWPQPDKFLPFERWSDDENGEGEKKNSLIWLPFGAGPRNCIGMRFAMIEAKLVLAHVLQRFRFELSPGQVPLALLPGITTSPKHGINVTVHRRS